MNSSPPQRATRSSSRSAFVEDLGEHAQGAVAGLVAVRVVQLLEVVEVGGGDRKRPLRLDQVAQPLLERPPVVEPGEAVGRRLELGLLEGTDGADARARLRGERGQLRDLVGSGGWPPRPVACRTPSARPMKPDRNADGRARPAGPVAQLRAGVERLARLEHDRVAAPDGDAGKRRVHRAARAPDRVGRGLLEVARLESESSSSIGECAEISTIARSRRLGASSSSAISSASTSWLPKLSRCACLVSSSSSSTRSLMSRALSTIPLT